MTDVATTVKSIKEASSYIAMSTGAGMTQTSITIIQVIGVIIGAGGLIVATLRWMEAKRTNDFNREKWEHEKNAESKND